ncbi:1-deoxy-D-xylulose-5-phosphate synthase [Singulisphaera sp. Ch08]|uniref:1-deoxy-D-xylulose-5-phosphate synthase n=1 Tax=Singulisphaera sp. Ch08 TaxID=3120278 RepID=A0AAU7CMX6_9BACT
MQSRIMYVEDKASGLTGPASIGRVTFSQTGRTLYYRGKAFQSLSGQGYKANYSEVESGAWFWISGCRKDGCDSLYPQVIEIDEDVREEYWLSVRGCPANVALKSFRSPGKYTKSGPVTA